MLSLRATVSFPGFSSVGRSSSSAIAAAVVTAAVTSGVADVVAEGVVSAGAKLQPDSRNAASRAADIIFLYFSITPPFTDFAAISHILQIP